MSDKGVLRSIEFKNDHNYSLQLNRWYLKPIGAWPLTGATNVAVRVIVLLQNFICWSIVCFIMIPCFLYMVLEAEDIQSKLNAFGPLLHRIMGSINYLMLLNRRSDIRDCIQQMEADWRLVGRNDDREMMLQQARLGRLIALIAGIIMQGGTLLYSIAKAMKTVTIVVDNETLTMYPMTCPSYRKIIDTRFSPTNEFVLVVQFMSTFIVGSSIVGVCSLAAVFATHACGQLSVLYKRLDELDKEDEKGNYLAKQKMVDIVERHLRILSFVTRMENIFHNASFVEVTGSTITMCLLGYYSIMNWANFDGAKIAAYIIVYVSQGFNLFIFCYIGEILTEQCKNVGQAAYMTNWYNLNQSTARGLVLVILRSSKLIKITAGKLFQLSIATFGDVLRTSVAYLNILRTMTT
ncbi:PREDICTED: odorant receptor 13a-like [Dinoponera quadriceps]|uniref:Odorant receptor n=1 Tax=Dinoponera quadriceps TaxID=609295 RepID=A0A6P3Y9L2_DINQU|nr:PREDICTED: odorant receptor 13a-like [Dinoponera quadriceps]